MSDGDEDFDADAFARAVDGDAGSDTGTDGATNAAPNPSESSDESSVSPADVLFSTEPEMNVEDMKKRLGVGDVGAHTYVGVRKMFGAVSERAKSSGTMAVEHLGIAGLNFATDAVEDVDAGDDQADDDGGVDLA